MHGQLHRGRAFLHAMTFERKHILKIHWSLLLWHLKLKVILKASSSLKLNHTHGGHSRFTTASIPEPGPESGTGELCMGSKCRDDHFCLVHSSGMFQNVGTHAEAWRDSSARSAKVKTFFSIFEGRWKPVFEVQFSGRGRQRMCPLYLEDETRQL